ncbi:MAG TPA: hypothetical protein VGY58_09280 [Gemmataceae bacterium]|jgi:hypothetical protein|nr:hypothetical protein [Gemmataceae bacterium]
MALTLRFAAITALPWSDPAKYQFVHDFLYMVKENPKIDFKTLGHLGDLVYRGGSQDIAQRVAQAQRGEKVSW